MNHYKIKALCKQNVSPRPIKPSEWDEVKSILPGYLAVMATLLGFIYFI